MTLNPYYEGNDQGAMIDDDALIRVRVRGSYPQTGQCKDLCKELFCFVLCSNEHGPAAFTMYT